MAGSWHNGSGSVVVAPARIAAPRSADELAAVVRGATRVRVVSAGHSFAPLCVTDGTLVRLDAEVEPMFRAHGGRPHWGKRHALTARDVFALYPQAGAFCAVRRRVDPEHEFANDLLTRMFDLEAPERP